MNGASWFEDVGEKLRAGARLSELEIAELSRTRDLVRLGALADDRRRALRGDRATFVRLAEVPAERVGRAAVPEHAGELRIARCPDTAELVLGTVREAVRAAGHVPVSGFALDELVDVCGAEAERFGDLVGALRDEGLAYISEARIERMEDPAWVAYASAAGVAVARWTIGDQAAMDLDALRRLADWNRDVAVPVLAPLPRMAPDRPSTGYEDARQVALARLLVDNIESIQVDWRRYGPQLAQVALTFGADDVDGVSPSDASEHGPRRAPLEEITRNIRAAGLVPVERDGRFRTLCTDHQ